MHHNESPHKAWWRSRHPIVTYLDCFGAASSLWWLYYSSHWTTDVYVMTVVALYSVSALYHHTVYRDWLGKLDHIMIFYVISITALPYWGYIIPFPWYPGGLLAIIVICVVGTVVKTVSFLPRFVSGAAYLAAAVPMVSYFIVHYSHIPTPYGALWMIGLFFHGGLLVVYTLKTPDPFPALFGFREVQHVLLVCATNLHSYVAITVAHNISHSP